MDGGEIMQMGTHAELLADADGLYRQLCVRQFGSPERDVSKTNSVA
jgi:ABC-type multidrug transport system fused ATPase/permease subunit